MNIPFKPNSLYYGDCLNIMRDFPDESIDLICLDPPFNSNQKYNAIFKRDSGLNFDVQIKAFDDMWHWNTEAAERVAQFKNAVANPASKVIAAFDLCIPKTPMLSYTSYMAQRLFEMHRILKPTGSIYLHCDPTASHYLKLVMDAVFDDKNFRNEIVWCYAGGGIPRNDYPRKHDVILRYSKSKNVIFNTEYRPYGPHNVDGRRFTDRDGTRSLTYRPEGTPINDWWTDINPLINLSNERLGYPTQKPLALYERIIKASSNSDDLVLDPFAGCGTTIEAARKNNRRAIGIDILPFALRLINQHRLAPKGLAQMPVYGVPVDFETASSLAKSDPYKFQDWAISLTDGLASNPQKSGDEGIDGFGVLEHKPNNMDRKAIVVQVTGASGAQLAKFERLQTTIRNTNAAMGILITLDPQPISRWQHNLEPVRMGETRYEPIQCFAIKDYYRLGKRYDRLLTLPPLANPWTGKPMQKTLFDTE